MVSPPKTSGNWSFADILHYSATPLISSVAVDSRGRPHIAFAGWSEQAIYHAFWTGTSWQVERVCDTIFYATPIIALDSNDAPHIVISDYFDERLMYAYNTSGQWITEIICYAMGTGLCGIGASFVLDSRDRPHISYYDILYGMLDDYFVMYVTRQQAGEPWDYDMLNAFSVFIDDQYYRFRGTSLVLDSRGHPRIAYAAGRTSEVVHASYDGSRWSYSALDCLEWPIWASACGLPSLALDANDRPHISFFKDFLDPPSGSGYIAYAAMNGTSWDLRHVHDSGLAYSSIVTDRESSAHIFYLLGSYLTHTEVGLNMTTEVVDPQYRAVDFHPDGALIDKNGGYHVVYSHIDQGGSFAWTRYAHKWGRLNITMHRIWRDGGGLQTNSWIPEMNHVMDYVPILNPIRFEAAVFREKNVQPGEA